MNIMLLLMPANVALNIRCAGPGPDHDDRDHKEAMVLSEGHIQRGLNAQGDIFPDTGFQSCLQIQ